MHSLHASGGPLAILLSKPLVLLGPTMMEDTAKVGTTFDKYKPNWGLQNLTRRSDNETPIQ